MSTDIASDASYVASALTVIAGFTINEWGVIIGIILAAGTFGINWWYRHQNLKLKRGEK